MEVIAEKKFRKNVINMYLDYLDIHVELVVQNYFREKALSRVTPMDFQLPASKDPLTLFIKENKLNREEILVLLIALAPYIKPCLFDLIIQQHIPGNGDFPQLGGVRGKDSRIFMPTGETALFLLAANELDQRSKYQQFFDSEHLFSRLNVLWLENVPNGEPKTTGKIILNPEYAELFTTGKIVPPKLSLDFPAHHITTEMTWEDIVLSETTLHQITELENWVKYHQALMQGWNMKKKLKPGYRALFYGPPGTGKTLTATLLGKHTGKEVFKIDLSMVVSKFIGETEKNLSHLFNRAENKNWILFFDEADALFSKRTSVRDSHDKYANQEAAYLLQRIENFDGLVILATNFRNNIDEAFIRRFHSVIHFPPPVAAERLLIWQKGFPEEVKLSEDADLLSVSKKYDLTGSAIMNAIQYACLQALSVGTAEINNEMIVSGIRREYLKMGKMW